MKHRKRYDSVDITGKRFGRLLTIGRVPNTRSKWLFQCDCGKKVQLSISKVLDRQRSCGCLREETQKKWGDSHITHGMSRTKLYKKYKSMLNRCYRKDTWNYNRYGGRGIYVCEEWKNSFSAFAEWAFSTGYDPDIDGRTEQSIDRIDNDKPYCPENCKWSTAAEQQKNRECTTLYPYKGKLYSASEFADTFGISEKTFVYRRLKVNHQSLEYILNDWIKIHNVPEYLAEVSEYAQFKGVTKTHVTRLLKSGKIKGEKVGRKWYVNKTEFDGTGWKGG